MRENTCGKQGKEKSKWRRGSGRKSRGGDEEHYELKDKAASMLISKQAGAGGDCFVSQEIIFLRVN